MTENMIQKPADIEAESMRLIGEELAALPDFSGRSFSDAETVVLKRIIHATADFSFAGSIRFTEDPTERAAAYLKNAVIVSDTNMILSGISKPSLEKYGAKAFCFMSDPVVVSAAKARGVTRAVVSMEHAVQLYPQAVFLIGNAPTALLRLSELIEAGEASPALVAGVPVGFVNVTESKEIACAVCKRHHIPSIFTMGRKGGSTVAVAIINALLYHALHATDPHERW